MKDTVSDLRAAATRLEELAARLRTEARWLEENWPLSTWSAETATNYLRAARAQAYMDTENTARRVVAALEAAR